MNQFFEWNVLQYENDYFIPRKNILKVTYLMEL